MPKWNSAWTSGNPFLIWTYQKSEPHRIWGSLLSFKNLDCHSSLGPFVQGVKLEDRAEQFAGLV